LPKQDIAAIWPVAMLKVAVGEPSALPVDVEPAIVLAKK